MVASRFMVVALLIGCVGLSAGTAGPRQAPSQSPETTSMKGVVPKGKAPVSNTVLRVKLPRPAEVDLSNGAHLMVLEDRRVPIVSVEILIPGAGGYYDPAGMPGLASVTTALMREGTATRSSEEIARELETTAASLSVSTSAASQIATLTASGLTDHLDRLLELTADVLLRPSFPPDELQRYKTRTRAVLIQQRSNPGFLATELFSRVVYGSHPAGRQGLTPEGLDNIERDALVEFHRRAYAPDHSIVGISGDISIERARRAIEAKLGSWKKVGVALPGVVDPPDPPAARIHFVDRPNSVQTNLVVGALAINRTSPDYEAFDVMNKIIGGGPTGRLFMILREDKGYTYGAYSRFDARRYRGAWEASTEVRTEVTEPALRDLLTEVARIRDEPVPLKEFQDAKRSLVASFALSLESPSTVLANHITRRLYSLPVDYWDKYPERIIAVTAAEVQAVAKKYLDAARLQIVAVGDRTKIGDGLKRFGEVDVYDTEGKRITVGQ